MNIFLMPLMTIGNLLGQSDPVPAWEGVKDAFRHALPQPQDQPSAMKAALIFISGLAGVVLVLYLIVRTTQKNKVVEKTCPPNRFFGHVLRQMGIGARDRMLLRMAGRHGGLAQPTIMLLDEALFEKYVGGWADSLNFAFRGYVRSRMIAISSIAFVAEEAPAVTA